MDCFVAIMSYSVLRTQMQITFNSMFQNGINSMKFHRKKKIINQLMFKYIHRFLREVITAR